MMPKANKEKLTMATYYRPLIQYNTPLGDTNDRAPWEYLRDGIILFESSQDAAGRSGSFDRTEAERLMTDWEDFVEDWKASDAIGSELIIGVVISEEEIDDEEL
tara:strand:+ start:2815 stop:3126 length:312 start_codon:yes stop_codon:yes gene_type:complete